MSEVMLELQPYLIALLVVFIVGITSIVGIAAKVIVFKLSRLLDSKDIESKQATLTVIGKEAFAMAETSFQGTGGESKLQEATNYANKKLDNIGIKVPAEEIQASINTAWIENKSTKTE